MSHLHVTEEESEDRSVLLSAFAENGIECKLCMNTICRDKLSLRVCVSESSNVQSDMFACIKENPICSECAERMRTQGENRCPFCRQPNVFRKPRSRIGEQFFSSLETWVIKPVLSAWEGMVPGEAGTEHRSLEEDAAEDFSFLTEDFELATAIVYNNEVGAQDVDFVGRNREEPPDWQCWDTYMHSSSAALTPGPSLLAEAEEQVLAEALGLSKQVEAEEQAFADALELSKQENFRTLELSKQENIRTFFKLGVKNGNGAKEKAPAKGLQLGRSVRFRARADGPTFAELHTELLRDLERSNLQPKYVGGRGDCLFCCFLHYDGKIANKASIKEMRNEIANAIRQVVLEDPYMGVIFASNAGSDRRNGEGVSIKQYIAGIRNKAWGDTVCITQFCRLRKIKARLHTIMNSGRVEETDFSDRGGQAKKILQIIHHPDPEDGEMFHYEVLVPKVAGKEESGLTLKQWTRELQTVAAERKGKDKRK